MAANLPPVIANHILCPSTSPCLNRLLPHNDVTPASDRLHLCILHAWREVDRAATDSMPCAQAEAGLQNAGARRRACLVIQRHNIAVTMVVIAPAVVIRRAGGGAFSSMDASKARGSSSEASASCLARNWRKDKPHVSSEASRHVSSASSAATELTSLTSSPRAVIATTRRP
eukprot:CAMPEP_0115635302 /NCGR_PEP_ID=MMETSP0272-20121206/33042_1 /TAXON_ID=71861 /ORGANISM="Scrippsiella trochoidea, Strain CCMP3099" /LENGTH=171 /DNA_ID=CAMNT_0003072189 /DNA_START=140 /DNA_END=657 /DNA_ORIENTATION=-